MLRGLIAVVGFDIAGEGVARYLHVPLPGPVIGMVLLVIALAARDGLASKVEPGGTFLLQHMSLFFIPPAVGVMTELDVLRAEWLPIAAAVVGSTLLALAAGAGAFVLAARGRS